MAKRYTDEEILHAIDQTGSKMAAASLLQMNERGLRRRCNRMTHPPSKHAHAPAQTGKTYLITSAVNATKVHPRFIKSMLQYCAENEAELLVIPMRYRNPTNRDETQDDDWWDARVLPYLLSERTRIAPGLVVMADIKIQPTAVRPLTGWLTVSGTDSAIFGHTKIALETVATHPKSHAKIVQTTGSCTVEQYSDTNAGAKGTFHHTLGAIVVEICGTKAYTRHICPLKDGSFIDLDRKYTIDGSEQAPDAEAITMGDIHAELVEKQVIVATKALAARVKAKTIFAHDVLNFGSASHHSGYFERYSRHVSKTSSVLLELQKTAAVLDDLATCAPEIVMINSNHHDHFTQWLSKSEHAHDLENALVFHETKAAMLRAIYEKGYLDPFRMWMDKLMVSAKTLRWLKPGEPCSRKGVEFSWHGHKGPNGARGSTKGFANVGAKVTKGHSHAAQIIDGAHSVGLSGLMNMGYNADSPSGWTWTHEILYANGKRTLVHCVGGSFFRA